MKKILFVCSGNTCRSPMAEGLLRTALEAEASLSSQYAVFSAGITAWDGGPASENAVRSVKEGWQVDISRHRSTALTESLVSEAFLILAMTRSHKEYIQEMFPEAAQKVHTLKEYVRGGGKGTGGSTGPSTDQYNYALDVTDPWGMSQNGYNRCAAEIKEAVDGLVELLKKCDA